MATGIPQVIGNPLGADPCSGGTVGSGSIPKEMFACNGIDKSKVVGRLCLEYVITSMCISPDFPLDETDSYLHQYRKFWPSIVIVVIEGHSSVFRVA